jgi:hypothetical protein
VYAYSNGDLECLLRSNRELLEKHGWPTAPDEFVKRIAARWLDSTHPIMPVISDAFGK